MINTWASFSQISKSFYGSVLNNTLSTKDFHSNANYIVANL